MADSIGEYALRVTTDSTGFKAGLDQAANNLNQFKGTMATASTEMLQLQGSSGKATFAIQQLAFGAQDAATVFGTSGFAGAVRASSNNIIQFASLLGPMAGTIAALAGTGIALLVDWWAKHNAETEKAIDLVKNLKAELEGIKDFAGEVGKAAGAKIDIGEVTTADQASGKIQSETKRAAVIDAEIAALKEQQAAFGDSRAQREERAKMMAAGNGETFDAAKFAAEDAETRVALSTKIRDLDEQREKIAKNLIDLEERRKNLAGDEDEISRMSAMSAERSKIVKTFNDMQEEQKKDAEKKAKQDHDLRRSILGETAEGKAERIVSDFQERIKAIESSGFDEATKAHLKQVLGEGATQDLNQLAMNSHKKTASFAGAAEFGSKEAFGRLAEAMSPRDRLTEAERQAIDLARKNLKAAEETAKNTKENKIVGVSLTE